jgi:MFS family permease
MASTQSSQRSSALQVPARETDFSTATTPAVSQAPSVHEKDVEKAPRSSEESSTSHHSVPAVRSIRGAKWFLLCVAIYATAFLYGLDTTIAADVQGPVVEAFGEIDKLAWIGAGFPMGSVATILLIGNLYGNFNMKWVYIASILLFEIGSVLCGASPNMNALISGRVIAGIGGAGIYLGCLNYFSYLSTAEERGFYISLTGLTWGAGAVLGPVIGGAFSVSSATWRWAFYINLVIGAATAPVYYFFMPSIHNKKGVSIRDRIVHFDFLGLALVAAVWILFTVSFTVAGATWAWSDGRTIAVLTVFGVVVLATVLQQYFTVFTSLQTRAFPGHLLKSRTQILIFIGTAASTSSLFVVVYFLPLFNQFVNGDSAIMAAVRLLPFIVVTVVINVLAGKLLSRIKYYMPMYLISGIFITLGGALLTAFLDADTPQSQLYGFTVIVALGSGLTIQLGYSVATLTGKEEDMGHAINFQNMSQLGSTVLCLVIAGQVFQSVAFQNLSAALAGQGFTDAEIAGAVAGAQSELFTHLTGALRESAISAIVGAMQKSFVLVIVAGAVMTVASLGMKREKLFGEIVTA